ncbi:uncharacterized protein BXZ73DRAFT_80834 [Epithele typhae]|uniref:uncharacterized protein n=1 Tax=Epithele typhae TaxID=378194 RepID=UPI002008B2FA|nr:uncharacterized protein BXZ73DRAFT_80834 [Epithele typhae]KAH9917384.1 hypothetical protein BXZ73DRAFT_80834 [Epithele typhae]
MPKGKKTRVLPSGSSLKQKAAAERDKAAREEGQARREQRRDEGPLPSDNVATPNWDDLERFVVMLIERMEKEAQGKGVTAQTVEDLADAIEAEWPAYVAQLQSHRE